jgi:nitrogen regulatory protein P-II 1
LRPALLLSARATDDDSDFPCRAGEKIRTQNLTIQAAFPRDSRIGCDKRRQEDGRYGNPQEAVLAIWGASSTLGAMKKIEAVVKHFRTEPVKEALMAVGVEGMSLSEVKGFGRQKGHSEIYRGTEYTVDFLPKVKFEMVVSDDQAQRAVEAILRAAKTGKIGDGKIFVEQVEEAVRIRTGERGVEAL